MVFRSRCGDGCCRMAMGIADAGDQDDLDQFDGAGEQRLLLLVDGVVLLSDNKNITWLKVYGMNSIVAYMLANVINFSCLGQSLFYGLEQYLGNYYSFLISLSNVSVIYVILWLLYKRNIFLKV